MGQPRPIRSVVIARVHEVALKGRNRRHFMRQLTGNIAYALHGARYRALKIRSGRILIELYDLADWAAVRPRVARVFGIENFSLTLETGTGLESIRQGAAALIAVEGPPPGTFRVRVKRSDKSYPLTSPEIERAVGGFIQDLTGAPVQLRDAGRTYQIELLHEGAYITSEVLPGPGGLPVGASGRVVSLISGGYDSPVAAYRMLKRGCELSLLHCHAYPFVRSTSIEKVIELVQHLSQGQPNVRLTFIPIGELQRIIALAAPPELRVVLYRRLMLRLAEALAREEQAGAIVTGESLGQVASQTLSNIQTIEAATALPVFRPLIGLDKEEILAQARLIGTEEISRTPDDDCCTVFVPEHPATHSTPAQAAAAEAQFNVAELTRLGLTRRVTLDGDPGAWSVATVLSGATDAALGAGVS